ncbi:GNAT family N-acetyltransferase [Nocardioides sp. W3-2-3]|uniref:GNAT family N-acetyltransferase n=1 Tax=Nocardioides convexus TaxID=2712224 RepID=UPI0024186215|nr:GNAT family N-acetyltransferase [Nocardioides convexus]NHA00033.1 GNAT family N-acetyltransferase [Nocardioides convexus]
MSTDDVDIAEEISADAFHALDLRLRGAGDPDPVRRPDGSAWIARTRRLVATDGPGCWVAEADGAVVGIATSIRREQVWCLVTFAVRPGLQGSGIGARLLAAAERHGAGCPRAMLSASADPLAARRYHAAGFALHPHLRLEGPVDRSALPVVTGLRAGTEADREWLDDLDRHHRGGPHGPDHDALAADGDLVVAADRSGYAYASPHRLVVLAAREEATARMLLWECLARAEGSFLASHVTAVNAWAVDVGLAARLVLSTRGYLGLRGMAPPAPYLHDGALL